MFFAHSLEDREKTHWQPLRAHLRAVGELAAANARKFSASRAGALAGLLHDLGKYSDAFQRRLEGGAKIDHATAGAQEILKLAQTNQDRVIAQIIAHAIAGHHAGLPDSIGELDQRLKKSIEALDPVWRDEISPQADGLTPVGFEWGDKTTFAFCLAFFGRMLFSCLVDADFRDTEQFYCESEGRAADRDWPELPRVVDDLIARFDFHMDGKRADDTKVNRLRGDILAHVRERAASNRGLFTLTVPTGGGKTLASLAFALEHAKRHGLDRIIYAIPFTSIIDQTASVFRAALGDDVILEHHSSIDEEKFGGREARDKLRLAMEDWAAPIVVTTNVQLFESLHANRPSRCRRLHNLARSVIILDEAQTIPLPLLRPCLATLDELARNYGTSIVLCTATQPAVAAPDFKGGLNLGVERELAPDPTRLHHELRRVRLAHLGDRTDEQLLDELAEAPRGLVIVNSRAHALALYEAARAKGLEGVIHLTTRQYAAHRRKILENVRARLKDDAPCRLIATSLVEAGVDLDFPRVWRAEAGLDQIAQAAGRCNREGKRPIESSIVGVFRSPEHKPPRELALFATDMARMMDRHEDLLSPAAMRDYFGEVYWRKGDKELDKANILGAYGLSSGAVSFDYRQVAENFRMIDSGLAPVIVARDEAARTALKELRAGILSPGAASRRLQSYIVQVPPKARALLSANGHVRFVEGFDDQFAELVTEGLYRKEVGLLWENAEYLGLEDTII